MMKQIFKRSLSVFVLVLAIGAGALAQKTYATGTVVDEHGEAVIGASVKVVGKNSGTVCDIDGKFKVACSQGDVLEASYIGYRPRKMYAGTDLRIQLLEKKKHVSQSYRAIGGSPNATLLGSQQSSTAQTSQSGGGGNYQKYINAANAGNTNAQSWIGYSYENGDGVGKDYVKAREWYLKAANKGDKFSQFKLGDFYYYGRGVTADYSQAIYWYRKAADQGEKNAQTMLGYCYGTGKGVAKDEQQAVYWSRKAADQGQKDAQYNLGYYYLNGRGVTKDAQQAIAWYQKAAEQGKTKAYYNIGTIYFIGNGVPVDYQQAAYWYDKGAAKGDSDSQKWAAEARKRIGQNNSYAQNSTTVRQQQNTVVKQQQQSNVQQQQNNYAQRQQSSVQQNTVVKQQQSNVVRQQQTTVVAQGGSDVDRNIPVARIQDKYTFAVIIGNEKYDDESDVEYAANDARTFRDYCEKTLGISDKHIRYIANAGYNDMRKAVSWLRQGMEAYDGQGRIIFYYAGHGIPDEASKAGYLLPVDGIGSDLESAYSLDKLSKTLGEMPAQSVVVFLDACFSGTKRDGQMMASARGVAIRVREQEPAGKMVVLTAAQGDETAYPYRQKQHGMFTYFLLKKLQATSGNVTLGELSDYITREVKRTSFDENNRKQTPSVKAARSIGQNWRSMKLK